MAEEIQNRGDQGMTRGRVSGGSGDGGDMENNKTHITSTTAPAPIATEPAQAAWIATLLTTLQNSPGSLRGILPAPPGSVKSVVVTKTQRKSPSSRQRKQRHYTKDGL